MTERSTRDRPGRDLFDQPWVADAADRFCLTAVDPETGRAVGVLDIAAELDPADQARLANFLERIPATVIPLLRKYAAAGDAEAASLLADFAINQHSR